MTIEAPASPWAIPATWVWARIGQITDIVGGGTPRTNEPRFWEGGNIPWLTPADLSGYRAMRIADGRRFITADGLRESAATMVSAGTVLMSSRAPIGYAAIALRALSTNQGFKSFLPTPSLLPEYLYYFIIGNLSLLLQHASGTTFQELNTSNATKIPVPVPPRAEQLRIVCAIEEHLSRLDAAVAALKRVQALVPRYRASVLKAAFEGRLVETEFDLAKEESRKAQHAHAWLGGPAEGPITWTESRLEGWIDIPALDLTRAAGYGTSEKCDYDGKGPPVLRIPNVNSGRIDLTDMKHARKSEGLASATAIAPGDLLIIRTNGSRGLIGRGAVVMTELQSPHYFASYLIRLRLMPGPVLWRWVNLWWNSPGARDALTAMAATSAGQYNISLNKLRRLRLPLPPRPEAERIIADIERRMSLAEAVESQVAASLARADQLRQSILKRAFEGKLVVQDSKDQPAAVLLERIRATQPSGLARRTRARRPA